MEKEEVTTTVTLLGTLPGDPPRILIGKRLSRDGKPGRLFQQMVPVTGAAAGMVKPGSSSRASRQASRSGTRPPEKAWIAADSGALLKSPATTRGRSGGRVSR